MAGHDDRPKIFLARTNPDSGPSNNEYHIYIYIGRYNEETKFSVTPNFVLTHSSDSI